MAHGLTLSEVASIVAKLKMYPYFDVANYILMSMMVREDAHPPPTSDAQVLSRKHPLASWFSTMLMCFASIMLTNVILGEPPITPFTNQRDLLTATVVWYVLNYSPFDITYKLCKFLPFKVVIYCMKEIQRASKVLHGVHFAMKIYPNEWVIICVVGVLKGAGYYYMRMFERLVRGTWIPTSNEILQPTLATKACLIASILFVLEHEDVLDVSHHHLYLGVVGMFIFFRLLYLLVGIHNPFLLFERFLCAIFFGGIFDAIRRALTAKPAAPPATAAKPASADGEPRLATDANPTPTGKPKEE